MDKKYWLKQSQCQVKNRTIPELDSYVNSRLRKEEYKCICGRIFEKLTQTFKWVFFQLHKG